MTEPAQVEVTPLPSPLALQSELPASAEELRFVRHARAQIADILHGRDDRLFVVVGPCSIHDLAAGREYAARLARLRDALQGELSICMRSYFEKPRTSVGWKGLLNDPHLDGSCDMASGVRLARSFLGELARLHMPAAIEALDPLAPRYFAELVSWSAIGARTTESQTHRELASGLAMPVGFKNGTDGSFDVAIHAMRAAAREHTTLGIADDGCASVVRTRGNVDTHVVLRGGRSGPNYARADVQRAQSRLRDAGVAARLMVDCSHDNSAGDHRNQLSVVDAVSEQVEAGSDAIFAVMLESHLVAGKQALGRAALVYGQSITDACIDFATTEAALRKLASAVRARRSRRTPQRATASLPSQPCDPSLGQPCA